MLNIPGKTTCKIEPNSTKDRKNMFNPRHKLYQLLSVCLLSISTSAYAASGADEGTTAYVDSVHGWGAWELGIKPAAGGSTPSPGRALASRSANIKFRPNDNSAFSPNSRKNASPAPVTPTPVGPITGPIAPGQPLPTGNPADRWL